MTQDRMILDHLKMGFSLTALDALHLFGCFRLASTIHRLRKAYHIPKVMESGANGKRWARYYLVREEASNAANSNPDAMACGQ